MPRSTPALVVRHVAVDVLGAFLYFPAWWYSAGLLDAARRCWGLVAWSAESFGVRHWIRNLFRPMYGLNDWQGRMISFAARLMAIAWYSFLLALLCLLALVLLVAYVAWPIVAVAGLWHQLTGDLPFVTISL